jgi:anti-sigma regulatory factor (Ser/Thr protein kinase)
MVTIPGPPVALDVVDMLTTVGQLAGAALERAIAYERDHRVAEELQQSLLGRRTSPLASLTANAGYRPGNAGLRVGGDWHDIMSLPGGRLLVTVGDVVGSGLPAAAAMGQLRSAMSALARVVEDPGRLLEHLSSFAEGVEAAQYATVCVAIVDPETGEVRYASAGHPPPLVVQRDGSGAYLWQGRSEPLACGTGRRTEALAVLPDGGSLVLYTDGLVERRQELIDDGLERLRRTVGRLIADETPDLPERILDAALDEDVRHDDAVVLVATIGTVPVRVFHHELPKDAAALAPMRQALRMWLTSVDADQPTAHDLVLVVNEAAANAVEHGEGNDDVPIRIRVAFDPRKRVFEGAITGAGRWREQRPTDRGRGLPIIRNLTDGVTLERRRGTTLTFRRTLRGASAEHAGRG